jgi:catechol 2,3-dioxygenase-like lactoylglutathione lyase family enzyme/DNA-binding CsgD family transcriptional regulator
MRKKKQGRGRPPHDDVLTPTQWRVTHAIQHGLTTRGIAEGREITRDGVKYHVAQILGKLNLPNRKALRSWFQAPKGSALARQETSMNTLELGAIGQIARSVTDIKTSEQWYREVLGLKHLYTFGTLAFFDCGGARLMLTQQSGAAESVLYFRVADIRQAHEQLEERGAEFLQAPHMIHRHADGMEEWMARFSKTRTDGRWPSCRR